MTRDDLTESLARQWEEARAHAARWAVISGHLRTALSRARLGIAPAVVREELRAQGIEITSGPRP